MTNKQKEALNALINEISLLNDFSNRYFNNDVSINADLNDRVHRIDLMSHKLSSLLQEANEKDNESLSTKIANLRDSNELPDMYLAEGTACPEYYLDLIIAKAKLIWPEQQEEPKDDAFEVVEYDLREFSFRDLSTRCQKDGSIFVGGMFCTELCSNFKGHEIEGESIRCSAKKEGE